MRRLFSFLIILLFIIFGYLYLNYDYKRDNSISFFSNVEILEADINDYYVYGNHFNLSGKIYISDSNENKYSLVMKNDNKEYVLNCVFDKEDGYIDFYTSKLINMGINLNELNVGNYYLLIKEESNDIVKYYSLNNNTEYNNIEYYTITKKNRNNKINIDFGIKNENDKKINYMEIKIKKSKLPNDVYDITIDPGHGGVDTGAYYNFNGKIYNESDFVLDIALNLKNKLEKNGYKVLLTRDSDADLDYYNEFGRAVLPNKYHTKLCISLHLNSEKNMNYGGVEVYVPNDVDYGLARLFAANISKIDGYSKKIFNRVEDGIYFNAFTEEGILKTNKEYALKGLRTYDILEGTPEMYMIREVGGRLTHAYVDGRNDTFGLNPYYQSNQVAEAYLIELGYISYESDLIKLINNSDEFSDGIKNAINEYFK